MELTERLLSASGGMIFRLFSRVEGRTGSGVIGWVKLAGLGLLIALISTGCRKERPEPGPTCYLYICPVSAADNSDNGEEIGGTETQRRTASWSRHA